MSRLLRWNTKMTLSMIACTIMLCVVGCLMLTGREKLSRQVREVQDWIRSSGGKMETIYTPWTGRIAGHLVYLAGSEVSDDELYHLRKLAPRIGSIDLSETGIDGSGMPRLADIANPVHYSIWELSLRRTMVTDYALCRFIRGASIGYLDLSDTYVTDAGIEGLITADIGTLDLSGTKVTGEGIRRLRNIAYLREVRLRRLPLNDNDIPALIYLAKKEYYLWILDLRDTNLSETGIRQLRDTLQSLHVITKILFEPEK